MSSIIRNTKTGVVEELLGAHGGMLNAPVSAQVGTVGAVAIPNSITDLLTIDVSNFNFLSLQINVATFALAAFTVQGRFSSAGAYQTLLTAAGDYTAANAINRRASGDLNVIGAAATGWILLDVRGIESIKLRATSANVGGSGVTVFGFGQG